MNLESTAAGERERQIDLAVVEYLRAEAAGETPERAVFLGRHADIAAELGQFFADRDAVTRLGSPLGVFAAAAGDGETPEHGLSPTFPAAFGPYELLAEIGRGGMGVVYRARQRALQRLVAIKMITPGACSGAGAVARFRNEAQAAARLQHPNVVQIFEVGEQQGQPYFAMEYVEGGSLARRLDGQPLPARQAAQLIETLARAVHAAHQCGVIHRDLKPGNVLLRGKSEIGNPNSAKEKSDSVADFEFRIADFEPMVTDFGLAKQVDRDVGMQTESGAILGTPCYMAPEQAEGHGARSGPTADVYSLGAMLYELLTGRPPFRGVTRLDTLQQIVHDEPVPPRRLQPALPRDLETICLSCLPKEPDKRYASAAALAEDLGRFRAGEPIRARPAGRFEIAWRWCCRQPKLAGLAAALVLAVATGLSLVLWQWQRAEIHLHETERLRREAVTREAALDESYQLAHRTLQDFLTQTVDKEMREGQGLGPHRRELLQKAQAYYEKFLEERGQDPALRQELAEASAHLANITRQIGTPEEALNAYRRALALFQDLARSDPDSVPQRFSQAVVHSHIANVLETLRRYDESLVSLRHAKELLEESLRLTPGDVRLKIELASTEHNLAMLSAASRPLPEALAAFAEARALEEKLIRALPANPEVLAKIAATRNGLGVLLDDNQRAAEALGHFQEAVAIRDQLARQSPGNLGAQGDLAESLCNLANCLRSLGRVKDSMASAGKARPLLELLARSSPHVSRYRFQLSICHANLGLGYLAGGEVARGLAALEDGRQVLDKLAHDFPSVPDYQRRLGGMLERIAKAHSRAGDHERALRTYQEQKAVELRLADAHPDQPDFRSQLALTIHNTGVPLKALGRFEEARTCVLQAVLEQRRALEKAPGNALFDADGAALRVPDVPGAQAWPLGRRCPGHGKAVEPGHGKAAETGACRPRRALRHRPRFRRHRRGRRQKQAGQGRKPLYRTCPGCAPPRPEARLPRHEPAPHRRRPGRIAVNGGVPQIVDKSQWLGITLFGGRSCIDWRRSRRCCSFRWG